LGCKCFGGNNKEFHSGIDYAAPNGSEIKSLGDGKVVYSGNGTPGSGYNGYGNVVAVKDNNGGVTLYGHMSQTNVSVGDSISAGNSLGEVGSTGRSSGNHVHVEYRPTGVFGVTSNPRSVYPNLR
jgi:murein DD-endopeptidase MepM/ murein hydrolase activator NlpD